MARNNSASIDGKASGSLDGLVHYVGEDALWQQVDVLDEEAEDQLVEEMRDALRVVVLVAQAHRDAGEPRRGLGGDALARLGRAEPLRRDKAGAQRVARLRRDDVGQPEDVLLGDRVGEVRVDADLPHVRHDQQRRVVERVGIALELRIGLDEVLLRPLVFPGEAALLPDIGIAAGAAELQRRFLEGVFGSVRVDLRRFLHVEQFAQIEKMLLRRGFLRSRRASSFVAKLLGRHRGHSRSRRRLYGKSRRRWNSDSRRWSD